MATTLSGIGATAVAERAPRPSFLGVMRGEWIKLSRQWTFWIMLGLMVGGYILFTMVLAGGGRVSERVKVEPLAVLYTISQSDLFLLRVFWGMMLIIMTARLIGMEYSGGTIRVLLARGVGRLQLAFAKLSVIALVALIGGALLLTFAAVCDVIALQATIGNLDVMKMADATFWANTRAYGASVLVSMGVSILLAAAVTTATRSLAAGLSVSIAWFPVDNFSLLLLVLGDKLTHWDFWSLLSGDFLGLNLNAMPTKLLSDPSLSVVNSFLVPLTPVTAQHTLLIAGIYAAAFLVVTIVLTALPDVKE